MNDDNVIVIGNEEIHLDPTRFDFNEANLTQYLMSEAGWYNYFGQKLAQLEWLLDHKEIEYDTCFAKLYIDFKENGGGTEMAVKSKSESHPDAVALKEDIAKIKRAVTKVKQHLRAWDKSHENANSVGHTLRKEMDKLGSDSIRFSGSNLNAPNLAEKLDAIIGSGD